MSMMLLGASLEIVNRLTCTLNKLEKLKGEPSFLKKVKKKATTCRNKSSLKFNSVVN